LQGLIHEEYYYNVDLEFLPHSVALHQKAWAPVDDAVLETVLFDVICDCGIFSARLYPKSWDIELFCFLEHIERYLGVKMRETYLYTSVGTCLGRGNHAHRRSRRRRQFLEGRDSCQALELTLFLQGPGRRGKSTVAINQLTG
jgi:hypothetical protein